MTCSKETHTAVNCQVITMCTPSWAKEARVSDSDVVLFPQQHTCLTTVCAAHVPSGFLCLDGRKRDDNKLFKRKNPQHCRGAVGTSTRAVACALASKPQPLLFLHGHNLPCCRPHLQKSHIPRAVACTVRSRKNRSFSSVTVSLIVEVTVEKHRSAPGSATLELQGSGAPRAPATLTALGAPCKRRRRFHPAVAIKLPVCNGSINSSHTPKPHVSCESSKARLSWACHRRRSAT